MPGVSAGQDSELVVTSVCLSARMASLALTLCARCESRSWHLAMEGRGRPEGRRIATPSAAAIVGPSVGIHQTVRRCRLHAVVWTQRCFMRRFDGPETACRRSVVGRDHGRPESQNRRVTHANREGAGSVGRDPIAYSGIARSAPYSTINRAVRGHRDGRNDCTACPGREAVLRSSRA